MDDTARDLRDALSSFSRDHLSDEIIRRVIADGKMVPMLATYGGGIIDLIAPKPEQIILDDIGNGLSRECRFARQTSRFFSVAQHSVNVSRWIEQQGGSVDEQLAGLFHDASEAYIGDIPRPLKQLLPQYKKIEARLMETIFTRFGLQKQWPLPQIVHDADTVMLCSEAHLHLLSKETVSTTFGYPPNHAELALNPSDFLSTPYDQGDAKRLFMSRAIYLFGRR